MRLHACRQSWTKTAIRYDLIYIYKVVFGLVSGAASDLFTLTSLIHSSGIREAISKFSLDVTVTVSTCTPVQYFFSQR